MAAEITSRFLVRRLNLLHQGNNIQVGYRFTALVIVVLHIPLQFSFSGRSLEDCMVLDIFISFLFYPLRCLCYPLSLLLFLNSSFMNCMNRYCIQYPSSPPSASLKLSRQGRPASTAVSLDALCIRRPCRLFPRVLPSHQRQSPGSSSSVCRCVWPLWTLYQPHPTPWHRLSRR